MANLISPWRTPPPDNVSVLLGNGMGSFHRTDQPFDAGDSPTSVAVGDFNLDGKPDLAVANFSSDNVSILLGDGMGSFTAPTNFAAGDLVLFRRSGRLQPGWQT